MQSMIEYDSSMPLQTNYKPKRLKNAKNSNCLNYSQRKESVISDTSNSNISYMNQSKIPVPKAVKNMVK